RAGDAYLVQATGTVAAPTEDDAGAGGAEGATIADAVSDRVGASVGARAVVGAVAIVHAAIMVIVRAIVGPHRDRMCEPPVPFSSSRTAARAHYRASRRPRLHRRTQPNGVAKSRQEEPGEAIHEGLMAPADGVEPATKRLTASRSP